MRRLLVSTFLVLAATIVDPARAEDGDSTAACPLRFDANTNGLPTTCLFLGPFNRACGGNAVGVFAGDGDVVVVGIAVSRTSGVTFFSGEVRSDTRGTILLWQSNMALGDVRPVYGSVALEDGRTLRLHLSDPPFRVDGCPFEEFVGQFTAMVDVPPGLVADDDGVPQPQRAAAAPPGDPSS